MRAAPSRSNRTARSECGEWCCIACLLGLGDESMPAGELSVSLCHDFSQPRLAIKLERCQH